MDNLGRLTQEKDLRSVWAHEALNFTKWLIKPENIQLLIDTIGVQIEFEESESAVGDFRTDIYAKEYGTGKNIIIENQLEETDHNHLGKIITYASGKDASIVIWIVKHARDEFKKAVEWLNNHTDEQTMFFLLEIELWRIGNSQLAPKFNIVESPNEWAKQQKIDITISDRKLLNFEFWSDFKKYAENDQNMKNIFTFRKPRPQHWYNLSVGRSKISIHLTISTQKDEITAGIYIRGNEDLHKILDDKKSEFEAKLNASLIITKGEKDARIFATKNSDVNDKGTWEENFKWLCKNSIVLHALVQENLIPH